MNRPIDVDRPRPTFEQAINASAMLVAYYGTGSVFDRHMDPISQDLDLPDEEIRARLDTLKREIDDGEVTSHEQVARVIRSIGSAIGPFGGLSSEIDESAYGVAASIFTHQSSFSDVPKQNS